MFYPRSRFPLPLLGVLLMGVLAGCGKDGGPTAPTTNPLPAAVTNLVVSSVAANSATLTWTAPGADGNSGTATEYDLRYSISPITEANWASASQATGEPTPHAAGTIDSATVTGLATGTPYYFALKTRDEVATNWSALSNVASDSTDLPITDLPASTFDSGAEQWTAFQNSTAPVWATGGNPGGCIRIHDTTFGGVYAYFQAPDRFLGNQSAALSGSLRFDLKVSVSPVVSNEPGVRLEGGGIVLVHVIPQPSTSWSSYNLDLTSASGWKVGTATGRAATMADITKVLADVTLLRIRGEFSTVTGDDTYLDNVAFTR
jgi:hypothetical protein